MRRLALLTCRVMSAEVMKMPEPIIEPATIVVASKRPSRLGSVFGNAGWVVPDLVIVPMGLSSHRRRGDLDPHPVEGAIDEDDGHGEEDEEQREARRARQSDRELHGEKAEEGRELDDRVHGDGRRVLEGVSHSVAHDDRVVKRRALLLQLHLDELLRVVPRAPRVRHEDRLVEAEHGDRDEVADEKERLEARERERGEEDDQEDVEHAFLRVLRADGDDRLAVLDGSLLDGGVELDGLLDELYSAVGARRDRLRGGAREPIDDRAARDEPEEEGRMEDRELVDVALQPVSQDHDDGEDHRRGADDRGSDEDGLRRGLEGVPGAVVLLQEVLRLVEVEVEA